MTSDNTRSRLCSPAHKALLQLVFDRFRENGEWPVMRDLHVEFLAHGVIWDVADEIGFPMIKERGDKHNTTARIKLSIEAIALCDESTSVLTTFRRVLKLCAETYCADQSNPVLSCRQIQEALELNDRELVLMDRLLLVGDYIWEQPSTHGDPRFDSFTLSPDAVHYRNIETIDQYFEFVHSKRPPAAIDFGLLLDRQQDVRRLCAGLDTLHPSIRAKCADLFRDDHYPEAVTKGFTIVKDRLRELTGFERASDALGDGRVVLNQVIPPHLQSDQYQGVKFLAMAVDRFRNVGSHTSEDHVDDPVVAYEFLRLSSLVMRLLDGAKAGTKVHVGASDVDPDTVA